MDRYWREATIVKKGFPSRVRRQGKVNLMRRGRETLSSINESEQDFIHVMLSVMNADEQHHTDTAIKSTCLIIMKEYMYI